MISNASRKDAKAQRKTPKSCSVCVLAPLRDAHSITFGASSESFHFL